MKLLFVLVCCVSVNLVKCSDSNESVEISDECCGFGEKGFLNIPSSDLCASINPPPDIGSENVEFCASLAKNCCEEQFVLKEACEKGIESAKSQGCTGVPTELGKTCCEECSFGKWTGESTGKGSCGSPVVDNVTPETSFRKKAFFECCMEAADTPETTTTKKPKTTTTKVKVQLCMPDSCDQECDDEAGVIKCSCKSGFRLQADKKTCKDINECAEATEDLCTAKDTVCHNTIGAFKCVPIKKGITCPPGFKKNLINQVCDDINECQLPRPPCPKYLCVNTIGAFTCAGKIGKPISETGTESTGIPTSTLAPKNGICPPGFRGGTEEECLDIDECEETVDDCQRLSQHCINTYGSYFCQDHVSKRCSYPGFKINLSTGICEDTNECEESPEVCKGTETCVNLPGAYSCKTKISTLPKISTKSCQEGTRLRLGGTVCEDIDECREGTHLCDQFQNCINTYGGHECRCKNGFELDSSSGSCVDINECALKLDNCPRNQHCLNLLGTYTCTHATTTSRSTTSTTTSIPPIYEYEYYDSDEENYSESVPNITSSTTSRPLPPRRFSTSSTTSTQRPTTTSFTTTVPTTSTSTTTLRSTSQPYLYSTSNHRPRSSTPVPERTTTTKQPNHARRPDFSRFYPRRPNYVRPTHRFPETATITGRPLLPEPNSTVPDDRRTNEISGVNERGLRPDDVYCLYGYVKNEEGICVDEDECERGTHVCRNLEMCVNKPGGFSCECVPGFTKDNSGWCVPVTTSSTTSSTTTRPTTTTLSTTTPSTTTSATTEKSVTRSELEPSGPYHPRGRYPMQRPCELGYSFDLRRRQCVDIDECVKNTHTCGPQEECVNIPGGYRCDCGARCHGETSSYTTVRPTHPTRGDGQIITVGAQYGQRGSYSPRPTYSRVPDVGAISATCPWGYKLTPDKRCIDIDECARNISECGPDQRCENFYGGYSCQCPLGKRLVRKNECEDIDECMHGNPCSYNSECVNTPSSYHCICHDGFRNAPSNDKVCVDVDECSETPGVCSQSCSNTWGSYRCYCNKGYRLAADNKSCEDVNECEEYALSRTRGRLCGGKCINEPGSYRCSCPGGYRLSEDGRSCIDLDECETGEANCGQGPGNVCQNTRGSYHCHHISCPPGYHLESKHRCTRVQRSCHVGDWKCLQKPSSYNYNFITFVANVYLPTGSVDLFTMHGPSWRESVVSFELRMIDVQAPQGVRPAEFRCFDMRPAGNICVISLLCSLEGPQVVELELTMSLYQQSIFAGSAVARLIVIVSQYEF